MKQPKPRILLIDDDLALSGMYKMRLELEGFEVKHASGGEHVLSDLSDFKPDLVLLDLMLPKTSGFDVLKRIRSDKASKGQKVVVFSALGDRNDRQRASDLGADAFIVKSEVSIADLVARLHELVSGTQQDN